MEMTKSPAGPAQVDIISFGPSDNLLLRSGSHVFENCVFVSNL